MKLQGWLQEVPHGKFYPNLEVKLLHESLSSVATEEETTAAGAKTKDSSPKKKKQAMAASKSEKSSQQVGNDKENIIDTSKTCTQNYVEIKPFDGIIMNDFVEKSSEIEDVMGINVGGPVWAIDWLPTTTITNYKTGEKMNKKTIDSIEWRFLAVSSHPPCEVVDGKMIKRSPPDHYYDAPKGGINLIQIWAIPSNSHTDKDKVPIKPRMVFGLDHTSGVAWDLKWCINATTILPTEYKDALGLLSACFGDGTVQFYAVPDVSKDFLKVALGPQLDTVKKLPALVKGKVVDVIQLCIRWSPFHPNLLLSGASDGSIILWDMESAFNFKGANKTKDIEPLRIFQDADMIAKKEPFDWGYGWVAVRTLEWSPYDEFLFASTGNDSNFKLWDIRETRICLRSHRIRSTWGLSLQWLDATNLHISGDQGSIYLYDIVSGSYTRLHYHPQIDSPIWQIIGVQPSQNSIPLLISCCASGSIRFGSGVRVRRGQQYCIELLTLRGERIMTGNIKKLTLDTNSTSVNVSNELAPKTRAFFERDAALHRMSLSTTDAEGQIQLAVSGHAGLLLVGQVHVNFNDLPGKPEGKKMGRPCKGTTPTPPKKKPTPKKKATAEGRSLGSVFAQVGGVKRKAPAKNKSKSKNHKLVASDDEDSFNIEENEEEAASEEDTEVSTEPELTDDDDDNLAPEGGEADEKIEEEQLQHEEAKEEQKIDPEVVRRSAEYQMNLTEEEALKIALEISKSDNKTGTSAGKDPKTTKKAAAFKKVGIHTKTTTAGKKRTMKGLATAAASSTKRAPTSATKRQVSPAKANPKQTPRKRKIDQAKGTDEQDDLGLDENFVDDKRMAAYQVAHLTEEQALEEAIRMSQKEINSRAARMRRGGRGEANSLEELSSPSRPKKRAAKSVGKTKGSTTPKKNTIAGKITQWLGKSADKSDKAVEM